LFALFCQLKQYTAKGIEVELFFDFSSKKAGTKNPFSYVFFSNNLVIFAEALKKTEGIRQKLLFKIESSL
jgi:hypothetical protein